MKKMIDLISGELRAAFAECGYEERFGNASVSNRPDLCQYQCNGAMAAAKQYKKAPIMIANEVVEKLNTCSKFAKIEAVMPGFINIDLNPEFVCDYLRKMAADERLGADPAAEPITYTKEDQPIQYEVNFNQKLTINTQGSDAFTTGIGRMIDEIINAVNDVKAVEDSMAEVEKMLEDTTISSDQRAKLLEIKEQLKSEFTLKTDAMTEAFQRGLTITEQEQETLNVAMADLGGRYKRLQLTESRLSDQQVDFEDLLSQNEDADLVDTIIKYSAAETVYNSSLSAASKLVQTSLLDFL